MSDKNRWKRKRCTLLYDLGPVGGPEKWEAKDFDDPAGAASHAGYGLGDCDMRIIIWDWQEMTAVLASDCW